MSGPYDDVDREVAARFDHIVRIGNSLMQHLCEQGLPMGALAAYLVATVADEGGMPRGDVAWEVFRRASRMESSDAPAGDA